MLTRFIFNLIIDIVTLVCIIFWAILGATIFIPFLWFISGREYFNIGPFIKDMMDFKLDKDEKISEND